MSNKIYCAYCGSELKVGSEVSEYNGKLYCDDSCVLSHVQDCIEYETIQDGDMLWGEDLGWINEEEET